MLLHVLWGQLVHVADLFVQ